MELFKLFGSVMIEDKKAIKSLKDFDTKTQKSHKTLKNFGVAMGAVAIAAGTMAIAIGGKALKSAVEFEKQMATVGTLLDGDVKSKMANLGEDVKDISKKMGISTSVLTDGLYQVVSALGESGDSMKILEIASKGAAAGGATVTDAVNLLAAVTKGYGDVSVEAANKVSDLAFTAVKLGQTTFPELASSMGKVIPLASALKISQEELFGAMATLTGVTGGTAEVTSQLRSVMTGVVKPTKEMTEAMKAAGYESASAAIETEGLAGFLDILKEATGGNSDSMAKLFGSAEALTAVLALTGGQADNFREKTEAMNGATGATTDAFEIQQATVGVMFEKIKAKADVFLITLGEKLLPSLEKMLDWFTVEMPKIEAFVKTAINSIIASVIFLTDNANWMIPVLAGVLAGFMAFKVIGIISALMALYTAATTTATGAQIGLNVAMMANPIGLVILAIAALIAIGVALYMNWDKIKAGAMALWNKIKTVFSGIKNSISNAVNNIKAKVSSVFSTIGAILTAPFNSAMRVIKGIVDKIKAFFNFKVSLPRIKLPHFAINPRGWQLGDLLKGKIPSLGINWYAKGGIFNRPTIFPTASGFKGVGEAGPEAVAPISVLQDYVRTAVKEGSSNDQLTGLMQSFMERIMNLQVVMSTGEVVGALASPMDAELRNLMARRGR